MPASFGAAGAAPAVRALELTSPGNLTRGGRDRKALRARGKVPADLHPLRNGSHGGALVEVMNETDGKTVSTNRRASEQSGPP